MSKRKALQEQLTSELEAIRSYAYRGFAGVAARSVADSRPSWSSTSEGIRGRPNVVLIVADDMGFSDVGPFGSEISTPSLDRMANRGVRLVNYHTAPACSPARAALLTGLNPHRAGFGAVSNFDPGFPGYTMELGASTPSLAEILRDHGYATMAVGKWHLTRTGTHNPAATRTSWPLQRGFDRYYGVLEGLTNYHQPGQIVLDNSTLPVDSYPDGYYLTDDYTDQAIRMIHEVRSHEERQPFFLYLAHNAPHAPLHALPGDVAKYAGVYDAGWDKLRTERFRRQLELGMFPPNAVLPGRNFEEGMAVGPWDSLPDESRPWMSRYMAVYAAMITSMDRGIGRLLDAIDAYGELDNTVTVFCSDNGASSEGGRDGTSSYFSQFTGAAALPASWNRDVRLPLDLIGGPQSMPHYPRGWAMVSNTPFRLYKGSTYAGGVRVPCIWSWPVGGIGKSDGPEQREEYIYVTDVTPTILDLLGIDQPVTRYGLSAPKMDGVSAVEVLRDANASSKHLSQYCEYLGNRSIYEDGWKLVSIVPPPAPVNDRWKLYDIRADPTEVRDLSSEFPDRVERLKHAWERAAWANTVYPQDDGSGAMRLLRRPDESRWEAPLRILPGTPALERTRSARLIHFRTFEIEIEVDYRKSDEGVLVAHGDQGGGYVAYIHGRSLVFAYNEYGKLGRIELPIYSEGIQTYLVSFSALPEFRWEIEMRTGEAATVKMKPVAMLIGQAPFQGISVGCSPRSPVDWELYSQKKSFAYSGQIVGVTYRPGKVAAYDPYTRLELARVADAALE